MNQLIFTTLFLMLAASLTPNAFGQEINKSNSQTVTSGVSWNHQFLKDAPRNINYMRIDISDPAITLETESGKDRLYAGERVLDSVKREAEPGKTKIVGAVNADFWSTTPQSFTPLGLLVADGMIYNMPSKKRSAFAFTKDETPYIGTVTLNVSLDSDDNTLKIDRINSGFKSKKEIVLFTPPFGQVGPSTGKRYLLNLNSTEFLPNKPVSVSLSEIDSETSITVIPGTMILHIPASRAAQASKKINSDKKYILNAQLPEVKGVVESVCGGGPRLIHNGEVVKAISDEGFGVKFSTVRHPRTAIGFSKDKKTVFLMTIDGRQPKLSIGATLLEVAKYMKELGCYEAMNLDGGGSTTMVVDGKLVNSPCDLTGPRTVASSLLVVELLNTK